MAKVSSTYLISVQSFWDLSSYLYFLNSECAVSKAPFIGIRLSLGEAETQRKCNKNTIILK